MKLVNILILLMVVILGASGSYGDIYTWTDENGVRHYSNAPPEDADDAKAVFPEYQYDEKADKKQRETEQKQMKSLIKEIEAEDARDRAENPDLHWYFGDANNSCQFCTDLVGV